MRQIARTDALQLTAGATVGIPPRQVDFRFPEDSPRYFYANNATATLFFAMLSSWFPPGTGPDLGKSPGYPSQPQAQQTCTDEVKATMNGDAKLLGRLGALATAPPSASA